VNVERRSWLRGLAGLSTLAGVFGVEVAAAAASDAAAGARLQRAEARRDAMRALVEKWNELASASRSLDGIGRRVDEAWSAIQRAHASDVKAVERASAGVPAVRDAVAARIAALDALEASARLEREAIARVARAPAAALGASVRDAEGALNARRRSETAFEELGRHLDSQGFDGLRAVVGAQQDLAGTRARIVGLQPELEALVAGYERLLRVLAATKAAQKSARDAGWVAARDGPESPTTPAAPALQGATSRALLGYPALESDTAWLGAAEAQNHELDDRAATVARLADAIAYLELIDAGKQATLAAERESLVRQRSVEQPALAQTRARLSTVVADSQTRIARLSGAAQAQKRTIDQLRESIGSAGDEASRTARQVDAEVDALLPAVRSAERAAIAEWEDAYAAVHGAPPLPIARAEVAPPRPAAAPTRAAPAAGVPPPLAGHAYDFFDAWDKEREGYGAYTYVVLRSASDLRTAAVQRRHERLLEIVQHQTDARDVSSSEAPSLNLFCLPVQATRERDRPDLGYGAALANQIKLRMQCGLFTRPELRQRLTGSAGPFLLTVPVRIGATDATTPLLLADLTTYPEAAIRDLATAYMGTLLRDFPRRQTLWKPPVAQKVALSLIWFASETSGLLQTVIPAGQAAPGG